MGHLFSYDGARPEIPEPELAQEEMIYLRSQDVYEKAQSKQAGFVGKLLRAFEKKVNRYAGSEIVR